MSCYWFRCGSLCVSKVICYTSSVGMAWKKRKPLLKMYVLYEYCNHFRFQFPRRSPAPPTPAPAPPPVQAPTPAARQETPQDNQPWVPHKPSAAKKNPKPSTNRDAFVLYVDAARYLPDNASIVKVRLKS